MFTCCHFCNHINITCVFGIYCYCGIGKIGIKITAIKFEFISCRI